MTTASRAWLYGQGLRSFSTATARSMEHGEHALAYSLESRAYCLLTASSRFHCRLMPVPQSSITSKAVCGRLTSAPKSNKCSITHSTTASTLYIEDMTHLAPPHVRV